MKYRNIIFDLYDVLIETGMKNTIQEILGEKNKEYIPMCLEFLKSQSWNKFRLGLLSFNEIRKLLPPGYPPELFDKLISHIQHHIHEIPEMISLLKDLRKQGYHLYLISNVNPETLSKLQQKFSFFKLFNGIVIPFDAHALKPDPIIYKTLLKKYNLKPEDCIFIDDKQDYIAGAQKVGITGILHKSPKQTIDKLKMLEVLV